MPPPPPRAQPSCRGQAARPRVRRTWPTCRGQAGVELVAVLPLVVVVLALAWQVVLVGHAAWSAQAAARAAARAHAVGGDELRAARASLPAGLDRRVRLTGGKDDDGGVALRLRVPVLLPGVPEPTITARSTFASQS